jgi:hypothetical protein
MKNDENFFLYLKGKMSSEQRTLFEDELKKSELLSNDFEYYKNLVHSINETKNIDLNKDYLESIVPNFRSLLERMDKKKSFKKLKYVFASLLIIVTGYFVISNYNTENKQELNQTLADLSNDEIDLIANNFYVEEDLTASMDDVSAQKIYSIYAEDLKTSLVESVHDINSNLLLSKFNITDIDQYLSDNEVDLIYSQLIEKKIL